jgi:hypothetical protein
MPRLSLYRPEKGNDYKFIDRQVSEMFQIGGTDVYVHKYLGPKNPTDANATADQPQYATQSETNIQDLLLLENRDRKYDPDIYRCRGHYQVQNIDFNLSQFGIFIDNDMIMMVVHINDWISIVGRKPLSGDVIELPHLKDEFALNGFDVSLPRYYSIDDVGRASEGFSQTWYPHLYRLKLKKVIDSQQFADILTKPTGADQDKFVGDYDAAKTYVPGQIVRYNGALYQVTAGTTGNAPTDGNYFDSYGGNTLQDILSTRNKDLQINDGVIAQAEADAPKSGFETGQFYNLAVDEYGNPLLQTIDESNLDASMTNLDTSRINERPMRDGYSGYLLEDGVAPNGVNFGHGINFPVNPFEGDFFLRTDFFPNRLFRYTSTRWTKYEDMKRHTLTNTDTRSTQKTGFINNTDKTLLGKVNSDTFIAKTTNTFTLTDQTSAFNRTTGIVTTRTSYNSTYGVKLFVDRNIMPQSKIQILNQSGFLAFKVLDAIDIGQRIEWSIYSEVIEQRSSLSKALKPRADL